MIKLFVKYFVKDSENTSDLQVRTSYSVLAGTLGIICNMVLFGIKISVGAAMSSIAIISDAFNNLSDSGTSLVSIIGAKLSAQKPDKEHPFGHGRIEYISSLIVSFIIMLVGFELIKTSVAKIFEPEETNLNFILVAILCASIPIKYWMYSYNKYLGKKINSGVLLATAKDSINDVVSTSAVVVSAILGKVLGLPLLDGIVGTAVSIIIMYSGLKISIDTIGILMGKAPEKETIESIRSYLINTPGISGVHDLIVHDYGPGRCLASVHAEVPDDCDVVKIHEIIDELEQRIEKELGIHIVVHMDPITVNCERTSKLREMVLEIVRCVDGRMNIHDFRMTDGVSNINLIFDIEVPFDVDDVETVKKIINEKIRETDQRFNCVINVDYIYD